MPSQKKSKKRKLTAPSGQQGQEDDPRFRTQLTDSRFQVDSKDPQFDGDHEHKSPISADGGEEDGIVEQDVSVDVEGSGSQALQKASRIATKKDVKLKKKGVVYLSSLPPFMKHEKVRHLLGLHGTITKMYLVPEDKFARGKRSKAGGNRKTKYVEGWVEFASKSVAKTVAVTLNQQRVTSKKGDHFYDDTWNIKFLKHFKWQHLTEKLAYEKRVRAKKLQAEIAQGKRENDVYLEKVVQAKKIDAISERKKRKRVETDTGGAPASNEGAPATKSGADGHVVVRRFRQRQPMAKSSGGTSKNVDASLLSMIVGSKKK
jgi:ESF2/ABP1 family protein